MGNVAENLSKQIIACFCSSDFNHLFVLFCIIFLTKIHPRCRLAVFSSVNVNSEANRFITINEILIEPNFTLLNTMILYSAAVLVRLRGKFGIMELNSQRDTGSGERSNLSKSDIPALL